MNAETGLDDMVELRAASFVMGSNQAARLRPEYAPEHQVSLPGFAIGRYPVTNVQYLRFLAAGGYDEPAFWLADGWEWRQQKQISAPYFWATESFGRPEQPVVGISWYEAAAYARWYSEQTGGRYHLPGEAEWERAARGVAGRLWPWGDRFEAHRANVRGGGSGGTTVVTAYPDGATPDGILDMAGNVWEWCRTRWGRSWQMLQYPYPYAMDEREDETGRWARVMRGGSWYDPWQESAAYVRGRYLPGSRASNIGFRLLREG